METKSDFLKNESENHEDLYNNKCEQGKIENVKTKTPEANTDYLAKKQYCWDINIKKINEEKISEESGFDYMSAIYGTMDPKILRGQLGEEKYREYLKLRSGSRLITSEKVEWPYK